MPEFVLDTTGEVAVPHDTPHMGSLPERVEWRHLDHFTQGYIEALFFTAGEELAEPSRTGAGAFAQHDFSDLAPGALASIIADCAAFQVAVIKPISQAIGVATLETDDGQDYTPDRAGRDFWFTRNGHGVGFWDRGLPCGLGDTLSAMCGAGTKWPSVDVYLGDDGLVYLS